MDPQGLIIEETANERSAGNVIVDKTELIESSDQPLDESLFEVPPDFTPHQPGTPLVERTVPGSNPQ